MFHRVRGLSVPPKPRMQGLHSLLCALEMASGGLVLIYESKLFKPLQFQMTVNSMG